MKKREKGPSTAELILKVQQQLTFLDKKVDALITQCSKPAERFDAPRRHDRHPSADRQAAPFRERILHKVICSDCKKECEVPFRPTGDRPVYCKDCFSKRKQSSGPHQVPAPRFYAKPEEKKGGFDKFRRPEGRKSPDPKRKTVTHRRKK